MTTLDQTRRNAHAAGQDEIAAARSEAADARNLLAALEEAIRSGDSGVNSTELRHARSVVEYADLRVVAAERRADQLAADARHQLYATVGAEAIAIDTTGDAELVDAFRTATGALRDLYQLAQDRAVKVGELARRAESIVTEAKAHDELPLLRDFGVWNAGFSAAGNVTVTLKPSNGTAHSLSAVPAWQITAAVLGRFLDEVTAAERRAHGGVPPWAGIADFAVLAAPTNATNTEFPEISQG